MPDFTCSTCGQRTHGDGGQTLCPACDTAWKPPQRFDVPPMRKEIAYRLMRASPYLIVAVIAVTMFGLLATSFRKVQIVGGRSQTRNNLMQIGLAFHCHHDVMKSLPFNGDVPAASNTPGTGSWAFQILPYVEQGRLYSNPRATTNGIPCYMSSSRGRPVNSTTGPWSDFCINAWVNDPLFGTVNAPDSKSTMRGIADGTSNTIVVGFGSIDPNRYSSNSAFAQSTDIFKGGDPATARNSTINVQDTPGDASLNWGSPYAIGTLFVMGDGAVRLFPFTISGGAIAGGTSTPGLGVFLTPSGNDKADLPEN